MSRVVGRGVSRFRTSLYLVIAGMDAGWAIDYVLAGQYGHAIGFGAVALILGAIASLLIANDGGES